MFTWWKRRSHANARATFQRYRPALETLETRAVPTAAINVGPTINVSQAIGNQTGPCVVVNPRNSNQVVVFSTDDTSTVGLFEAWSINGGATWNTQYIFNDPAAAERAQRDPQAAWDNFGNLFLTYETGSNDVAVALSTDGGQTFRGQVITIAGSTQQPSIAVGRGPRAGLGSVWVSYQDSLIRRHLETQEAVVVQFGIVGPFFNQVTVPGSDLVAPNFGNIAVGPAGQVTVTYMSAGGTPAGPSVIWTNIDPDGMGPAPFGSRIAVTSTNVGSGRRGPLLSTFPPQNSARGIDAEPNLAWDRSPGPHHGRLYLIYVDAPSANPVNHDTNIFLRHSDNSGLTWSAPLRVNDDTGTASQFNPTIAVDQSTGLVGIAWYDCRNDPVADRAAQVWATVSDDGGLTVRKNFQVSAGTSNSNLSGLPLTGPSLGYGPYLLMDFARGAMQVAWADNSPNLPFNPDVPTMEIATSRVRAVARIQVQVKVFFPTRWQLINLLAGLYQGQLTVVNTSPFALQGPFTLTIQLPSPSMHFIFPANTQTGTKVTFTINANLPRNVPLRIFAELSNPLHIHLPTFLIGYATILV